MFNRLWFWLGLLLGGGTAVASRRLWLKEPKKSQPDLLFSLTGDAVVICDASGAVLSANDTAQEWFGEGLADLALCYPTGQPVPPGQVPLARALRTGKVVEGAGYLTTGQGGETRALEVSARPLPDGGATALFRDITALHQGAAQITAVQQRDEIIRHFCRRLTLAANPEELSRIIAESALALLEGVSGAQARLYSYEEDSRQLIRLASAPEDRPKRPKSAKQAQPPQFPLDVSDPLVWQVYVGRQPFEGAASSVLGDDPQLFCLALPLLTGDTVLGHLSLIFQSENALHEAARRDSLVLLASVAALALAGPRQSAQAAHLAQQVHALRDVVSAVSEGRNAGTLADMVCGHVEEILGAELCTFAMLSDGRLELLGEHFKDALLFPEKFQTGDLEKFEPTMEKAVRTGKTVQNVAVANPGINNGLWRVFAGQSGCQTVVSIPLPAGQGVLSVYRVGETSFTDEKIRFLETLAALAATALP